MKFMGKNHSLHSRLQVLHFLPASLRFFLFSAVVLMGYRQDLWEVLNLALTSDVVQYILSVPPLFLFLLYKKRKALCLPDSGSLINEIVGFCLCFFAVVFYVWSSYTFYPLEFHLLSLPLFVSGCFLLLFGFEVLRALIFPTFLLIFLSPFPLMFLAPLGSRLIILTAQGAYQVLNLLGIPVELSTHLGMELTTYTSGGERVSFALGLPCSGLYSILGFMFFAVLFAYFAHGSWLRKTVLSASGLLLVYSLNIFRVILMVLIGHFSGYSQAVNIFHFLGGPTILFIGVLVLLLIGDKFLKILLIRRNIVDECPICKEHEDVCLNCGRVLKLPRLNSNWRRLLVKMLPLIILILLISQASYSQATVGEDAALNFDSSTGEVEGVFPTLEDWSPHFLGRDREAERRLDLKAVNLYFFSRNSGGSLLGILETSDNQAKFHYWEGCIYYQPYEMQVKETSLTTLYSDKYTMVIARVFIVDIPSQKRTVVFLYWFDTLPFNVDGQTIKWDVKVTLIAFVEDLYNAGFIDNLNTQKIVQELTKIGQKMEEHWSQIKVPPQTFIIDILTYKEAITVATALVMGTSLAFQLIKLYRERTLFLKKFGEQPEEDQTLLKCVSDAGHRGQTNGHTMADAYKRRRGVEIDPKALSRRLEKLRDEGLVKKTITAKGEQLYLNWRLGARTKI